jgi:hypothetical protein
MAPTIRPAVDDEDEYEDDFVYSEEMLAQIDQLEQRYVPFPFVSPAN